MVDFVQCIGAEQAVPTEKPKVADPAYRRLVVLGFQDLVGIATQNARGGLSAARDLFCFSLFQQRRGAYAERLGQLADDQHGRVAGTSLDPADVGPVQTGLRAGQADV
jgi:hypothetical protein